MYFDLPFTASNASETEKEKQTSDEVSEEQQQELPTVDAAENVSEKSDEAADSALPQPDANGEGSKLSEGKHAQYLFHVKRLYNIILVEKFY